MLGTERLWITPDAPAIVRPGVVAAGMPLLLDTDTRADALVAAINDVLIDHGPAGLTMRRIAARAASVRRRSCTTSAAAST